jgi:hypothetical protein
VSDTPRTDEQINGKPCTRFEILAGDSLRNAAVPSEFARQLERELNAANDHIKRLEEDLMDAKNQYAALVADVVLYEDRGERIKRLEEAGDAMEKYIFDQTNTRFIICAIQWRKAKEANP